MITQFLLRQMDYIFFCYGFSFILLAFVCYSLRNESRLHLPWIWLGLFGITHGVNEWLDMLALELGTGRVFSAVRLGLMTLSYVCLLEFGRDGSRALGVKGPGRWIHLPLLAAVAAGGLAGISGLNSAARYAYGLTGGLWAALTLFRASEDDRECRRVFSSAAVMMACYALATGITVPKSTFFPASAVNHDSFLALTGVPIQLIRGILALLITYTLWMYYEHSKRRGLPEIARIQKDLLWNRILFTGMVALILTVGLIFVEIVRMDAEREVRSDLINITKMATASLDPDKVKPLTGDASDAKLPEYHSLRGKLLAMGMSNPQFRWLYLMSLQGGKILFTADSVPVGVYGHGEPGEEADYEQPPPELFAVFAGGEAVAVGPYADEWGTFLSGFSPIRDASTGRIIGVLGIDIDAADWHRNIAKYRLASVCITLLVALMAMGFFMARLRAWENAQRLAASESSLAEAQKIAHVGHWTLDTRTDEVTWSEEMFSISGLNPAGGALPYAVYRELIHPEDRDRVDAMTQKVLWEEGVDELEYRLLRPDGTIRHVLSKMTARSGTRGGILLLGALQDITERKLIEQALQESENRFRQVADIAGEWIWEVDAEGLYRYSSSAVERILGYSPDELVGRKHFYDLFPPDEREALKAGALAAMERREALKNLVNPNVHKNGSMVLLETSGLPILDKRGILLGYRGTDTDITARKQAEDALRKSEEYFRSLLEVSPDGITVIDLQGSLTYVSPQSRRLFGLPAAIDLQGTPAANWIAPEYREQMQDRIRKLATGQSELEPSVYQLLRHDGTRFWGEIISAVIHDPSGQPAGIMSLIRDVTEREQADSELRSARAFLDGIIDSIADPVFVKDAARRFVLVNDALCAAVGCPRESLLGQNGDDLFPREQVDVFRRVDAIVLETGEDNVNEELLSNSSTGEVRTIITHKSLYIDPGGQRFIVGVIRDFTERKQAEVEREETDCRAPGGHVEGADAERVPADLRALQEDSRRPGLLEADRELHPGPLGSRVRPRHLPGVQERILSRSLREMRMDKKVGKSTRRKSRSAEEKPPVTPVTTPVEADSIVPPEARFPVVGIGASAGGLAAFEAFFSAMPADADPGMAFVLVQHLAPDHKSILSELVRRYTRMEVFEVEDGMVVRPNCAYIIPPSRDMAFLDGTLQLLEPSAPRGLRLPIDFFFRSLAQDQRERAIGIVLSGTGSDGTLGLRSIKGEGGMVMAQNPESTEFDGMPRSAIGTGLVDYVLPPAEMAAQLIAYVSHAFGHKPRPPAPPPPRAENTIRKILVLVRAQTGHDFSQYKQNTIVRRVERRMAVNQIDDLDGYLRFVQQNPQEIDGLFRDLLIGVTNFFRDPEAFKALEVQVIPRLFEGKPPGTPVRVWVPGCSTGEEAYSIAILLREHMEALRRNYMVQVFATDIDNQAIEQARAGYYPASIAGDVSPKRLGRFFVSETDGSAYRIQKSLRDLLVFSVQDVIKDPPFSRLDLISCRNLLIYMGGSFIRSSSPSSTTRCSRAARSFWAPPRPPASSPTGLPVLDRKWKLYQRMMDVPGAHHAGLGTFLPRPAHDGPAPQSSKKTPPDRKNELRELAERALLQQYTPAGALINERGDILYLHGRTGRWLEPAPGEAAMNILKMAREGLRRELTGALHKAATRKEPVRRAGLRVKTNGDFAAVNLTVSPVTGAGGTDARLFLVIFEEMPLPEPAEAVPVGVVAEGGGAGVEVDARIASLQQELRAKEEYLVATNEELETSNEELKSSNEEMQSVNEELQSTNEELETSKEELQSVNEELSTVNAELQNKVADLSRTKDDMNNLLAGTDIGTIFVDHQLLILRFTPAVTQVINLIQSDVGRPVGHIVSKLVVYDRLVEDVKEVLDNLVPKECEVQAKTGAWFLLRIRPYRTVENVIEGAVITFVDITEIVKARELLKEAEVMRRMAVVARDSHDAVTMHDLEGRILAWNPAAERMYGWSEAEALAMNIRDLVPESRREDALDKVRQLAGAAVLEPYRTQRVAKDGRIVEVWLTATTLVNASGKAYAIATTERARRPEDQP